MRRAAVVAAAVSSVVFSPAALAASKTTGPTNKVTVVVLIDDRGISVSNWVTLETDSNAKGGAASPPLQVLRGPVPRGDFLSFNIFNRGKKTHDFTILGKKTPPIKPGHKAHLFMVANSRGNFVYRSTLDRAKSFRGFLTIF